MLYLRARFYAPGTGRFLTKDTWNGDVQNPLTFNAWNYTSSNPINRVDPSGQCYNSDGSWNWFQWPWFGLGPCTPTANIPTNMPPPTIIAIFTATACTPTATSTGIPIPFATLTSTPNSEPWKMYLDYDNASNSIPATKWGGLDSNSWDVTRSGLVWSWLGQSTVKWWSGKYPNAKELTTWLLWQEGGALFNETPGDNVYKDGGGMSGAKLMIRFMKRLFSDGIDQLDLARFTAFFNPNSGGAFDQGDWNELLTPPPYNPYGNTVDAFWGLEPLNKELTWWVPGEPGFGYSPSVTVRHPNGMGDILYFAYK